MKCLTLSQFVRSSKSNRPHYLLLGHPVEHSCSPLMHNTALQHHNIEAEYHAINVQNSELTDLASFLNKDPFLGANVTIPYKRSIANYMDRIDASAQQIGAINTIVKNDYQIEGYNTDYAGFIEPLQSYGFELEGASAIIFGTGGAARAIVYGLTEMGVEEIFLVSRSPNRITSYRDHRRVQIVSYENWTSFAEDALLIVNATPLGMHPNVDSSPVRDQEKSYLEGTICYDIVYNPVETQFLKQATEAEAQTIDGLEMLIQQGSKSFELWTGHSFPINVVRDTLYEKFKN
ncbi:MAG: shikimate dehydrogenase [Nitrosopumilaceae archaeon]|nr:shikimate dehydrogenase [Nitrosopumilaceae archaeon]NIU01359.1 shikimate dehydrogenase [Nitrosopumilaceae archaeon]NIU87705.1 shikimate dehydrogenase [Nitrosopumilaceae archaeon]NIV66101.1 shikimate dehydrogenase [Nitrosopumilaceae archaeon]NIX61961.1 shikimate dehydrogenase [Nitrosopumilaceae archaeon]